MYRVGGSSRSHQMYFHPSEICCVYTLNIDISVFLFNSPIIESWSSFISLPVQLCMFFPSFLSREYFFLCFWFYAIQYGTHLYLFKLIKVFLKFSSLVIL